MPPRQHFSKGAIRLLLLYPETVSISRHPPKTLGALKKKLGKIPPFRSVRDEVRGNLIRELKTGQELFPGIHGYEDSVIPDLINALLSRHSVILLGLRGQAKSRILRGIVELLDQEIAMIEGCEIRDDPFYPICGVCRRRLAEAGDDLPIRYVPREERFVEKLATPDVTIADIIGDLDPIKASRGGKNLADHENIHFGLLPRAHRGMFAMNELPDLAPKIQVGLFNIMQEGDVQIKGFPIRLPLDILLVFSANPEDYTARGKIVTPLKDRIGSEIRTHYPLHVELGMRITEQESWTLRGKNGPRVPGFAREIVERIAFEGRRDKRVDAQSGVSQRLPISCLENCVSNAERRALLQGNVSRPVIRVSDIYSALPSITGKLELDYEGELEGGERVARELIQWFELGGEIHVTGMTPAAEFLSKVESIQGLKDLLAEQEVFWEKDPEMTAAAVEMILEGLCSVRRLSRNEARGYHVSGESANEEMLRDLEKRTRSFN